jgi:hypothetical protein
MVVDQQWVKIFKVSLLGYPSRSHRSYLVNIDFHMSSMPSALWYDILHHFTAPPKAENNQILKDKNIPPGREWNV